MGTPSESEIHSKILKTKDKKIWSLKANSDTFSTKKKMEKVLLMHQGIIFYKYSLEGRPFN